MTTRTAKATSVSADGEADGFEVPSCWYTERDRSGTTRLVASAPPELLQRAHYAAIGAMTPPVQVLYRQIIDRRDPKPQGSPARDFVGLGLHTQEALTAFDAAVDLLYSDARGEVWVRDSAGSQVVLDADGLLFCYPDDVAFRDALDAVGLPEGRQPTVAERDYVRHWFLAHADEQERAFIDALKLTEVQPQARKGAHY